MEILIAIAKFLGLALSTILGIVALLGKSHEEVEVRRLIQIPGGPETRMERRLTTWGKVLLAGILIGGIVGLTALVLDSVNQYHRSRESQIRTEEQLQLARNSLTKIEKQNLLSQTTLDQMQHVVMRFESLKVIVKFKVPASAFLLTNLISSETKSYFLTNVFPLTASGAVGDTINTFDDVERKRIVGFRMQPDGTVSTDAYELDADRIDFAIPVSLKILEQSARPSGVAKSVRDSMLNFLRSPKTTISIWRVDSNPENKRPDFISSGGGSPSVNIEYLYPSDRIQITLDCEYPESNWMHNAKMMSLPDLLSLA